MPSSKRKSRGTQAERPDPMLEDQAEEDVVLSRPTRRAKAAARTKLTSAPRQRGDELTDEEKEDEYDGNEDNDETPTRNKKTPAKASKKISSSRPIKSASKSSSKKPAYEKNEADPALFGALQSGEPQEELGKWMQRYNDNEKLAIAELLTTFVRCCGSTEQVDATMLDAVEESANDITATSSAGTEDDKFPLANDKGGGFSKLLSKFLKALVTECSISALFEGDLVNTIIAWLTSFSTSTVRAFRHTCTCIALLFGDQLVAVYRQLETEQADAQRQHDAEQRKKKPLAQKVSSLSQQINEIQEQLDDLWDALENIYSGVIVHRYRDIAEPIRAVAIKSLGGLIHDVPGRMLDDKYLKYIGWSLNDKKPAVRVAALTALKQIYSVPEAYEQCALFTQRFKGRMINMVEDSSSEVVAAAIDMMATLSDMMVIEIEEIDFTLELVFSHSAAVRKAAGKFLHATVVAEARAALEDDADGLAPDEVPAALLLKYVVLRCSRQAPFIPEGQRGRYVVDALWDTPIGLKDWAEIVAMLERETAEDEDTELESTDTMLTPNEHQLLTQMLSGAVERACGQLQVLGGRKHTANKSNAEAATEITEYFMERLPTLIKETANEPSKLVALVRIGAFLIPDIYTENRCVKHFEALVKQLKEVFMKNSDAELIQATTQVLFRFAAMKESPLHTKAVSVCESLGSDLAGRLGHLAAKKIPEDPIPADGASRERELRDMSDQGYKLLTTIERLLAISKWLDLSEHDLFGPIFDILKAGTDGHVSRWTLSAVISLGTVQLTWRVAAVVKDETDCAPDPDAVTELNGSKTRFLQYCDDLLDAGAAEVQEAAYYAIMNVAVIFDPLLAKHKEYTSLAVELSEECQQNLADYLIQTYLEPYANEEIGSAKQKHKRLASAVNSKEPNKKRSRGGTGGDDDGDDDPHPELTEEAATEIDADERIMKMHRQALSFFCRAIAYGMVSADHIASLLPYYLVDPNPEVIKVAMTKLRDRDEPAWRAAVLHSLQRMFEAAKSEDADIDAIKDIAKRIALSYGLATKKDAVRISLIKLHREGIDYALELPEDRIVDGAPPNIEFLDVLREFSFKLTKVDKVGDEGINSYLQEQIRGYEYRPRKTDDAWNEYFSFVENLTQTKSGSRRKSAVGKALDSSKTASKNKRKMSKSTLRTQREPDDDVDESDDGDEANGSQYPMSSQRSWIQPKKGNSSSTRRSTRQKYGKIKLTTSINNGESGSEHDSSDDFASDQGDDDMAPTSPAGSAGDILSPMSKVRAMRARNRTGSTAINQQLFEGEENFVDSDAADADDDLLPLY